MVRLTFFALLVALPLLKPSLVLAAEDTELPAALTVRVCEDDAEWPPYTVYERRKGVPSRRIVGAAVDALDRILGKAKQAYSVELLPWRRCQELIKAGSYHLALNASYSEERARDYWLSKPFYQLHSHYYFSRRQHPNGLKISTLADIKHYRVCGLIGYNYSTYGLRPDEMDLSPSSFPRMLDKLHHGRCDLFIEKREIMAGFALVDPVMRDALANPFLGTAEVPEVPATSFHLMATRAQPWGHALIMLLDEGVAELEASGEMKRIVGKYVK